MSEIEGPAPTTGSPPPQRPLRVAMYSGIVVERDAVSRSLLHKLEVLRRLVALGAPLEVTVFAQSLDDDQPEFRLCPTVAKLLGRDEFWAADLHIFEEGMYYELFDSVFLIPPGRPILAIEHNSTPAELVDVPEARLAVERSHAQRPNLLLADHVACVSELNVEMARSVGVPEERISVLHLPPAVVPLEPPPPLRARSGPVRLLYLGRFVHAKGIDDMLALVERLTAEGGDRFEVTLAGDPRFSDPRQLEAAAAAAAAAPGRVEVVFAPDDAQTATLFARADALVIPSRHEGYCVPVVEAYGFGRMVIAYDAGNLPTIMGGLGLVAPTGDVGALEAAVRRFADALQAPSECGEPVVPTERGEMAASGWREALGIHLRDYSAANFERRFLALFAGLASASPPGLSPGLERAITARLDALGPELVLPGGLAGHQVDRGGD